jgi:hypothetical protein
MKTYTGRLLLLGKSLRDYSDELGYEVNATFNVNEIVTTGKSVYIIHSIEEDSNLGVVARCEYMGEDQ